jgi:hypothetical protein
MTTLTRNECAAFLKERNGFAIITHSGPDGDTVGSAAALCLGLRKLGKTAHVLENTEVTERFSWLLEGLTKQEAAQNDTVVSVDVASPGMLPKAFEIYKKTAPAYIEDISEIHRLEPYVYAQMVAGKPAYAKKPGEAKNSFLTGTAAWNFVFLSQWLCGIRAEYDGLTVEPRLPKHVKKATLIRKYRGVEYVLNVTNNKPDGAISLEVVDGKATITGTKVLAAKRQTKVVVNVVVG